MLELIQHLLNGVTLGSVYALLALGYTLVFGILRLINFAHGDVFMVGAFLGLFVARLFGYGSGSSIWALIVTLLAAMAGCAVLGFLIERFAYRPLRRAPRINLLITAVGVSMLLEFCGQLVFGSDPKFFPTLYQPAADWSLGSLRVQPLQIVVLAIALGLMGILHALVFHSRSGRAMRAISFDAEAAALMGIPNDRIISATFMLGSALAGAAGILVGLLYPRIDPFMGVVPGLKCFIAAVLGGIGSVTGAVVGALILGLSEEFLVGYGVPAYRDALAFGILILVLLVRPSGLFGSRAREKV